MFIKPKKSLGQNFLIDRNVLEQIVDTVEIKNKEVIEDRSWQWKFNIIYFKKKTKKSLCN